MKKISRLSLTLLLLIFLLAAWPAGAVSAHAVLVSSTPAYGAAVDTSPPQIKLEFSEAVDLSFSTIRLVDNTNRVVVPGPGTGVPGDPQAMQLTLPHLPDGIYSVVFKNRSAEDGHVTEGVISFSVGKSTPRVSKLPPIGADYPAFTLPPIFDIFVRWLSYLGIAGMLGALVFGLVVWRPPLTQKSVAPDPDVNALLLPWTRRQIAISAVLVILATVGLLVSQTVQASNGAFFPALAVLTIGPSGRLLGVRAFLAALAWFFSNRKPFNPGAAWRSFGQIGALVFAFAATFTFSLAGHAAASGDLGSILIDCIHLAAVSAWIGGLLPLAILLRRGPLPADVSTRFTRMALVCVDLIAASGFYALWQNAAAPGALTGTAYGRDLLVKIGLFALLIVIGYANMRLLSTPTSRAARWLARSLRFELVVALAVLLAAGLLTGAATGDEAIAEQQRLGYVQTADESGVRLTLMVAPPTVGPQEIGVDLRDPRPTAAKDTVLIRLTYQDTYIGTNQAQLTPVLNPHPPAGSVSRFTTRGAYLSIAGRWQVTVIVRQPGIDDVYHMFFVQVAQ